MIVRKYDLRGVFRGVEFTRRLSDCGALSGMLFGASIDDVGGDKLTPHHHPDVALIHMSCEYVMMDFIRVSLLICSHVSKAWRRHSRCSRFDMFSPPPFHEAIIVLVTMRIELMIMNSMYL
jgi:hypothetical protein